jgi:hypothetical protein
MNPVFGDRIVMSQLQHGHSLGLLKGVIAAVAIIGIGVLTLAMPAMEPASDGAQQVAAEKDLVYTTE